MSLKRNIVRIITFLFAATLFFSVFSFEKAEALTVPTPGVITEQGNCNSNWSAWWQLDEWGRLFIGGTGSISSSEGFPDRSKVTCIVVLDGITSIGPNAFSGYYNLRVVHLAASVTTIGNGAFKNCSKLYGVFCPDEGLRTIGNNAFSNTDMKMFGETSWIFKIPSSVTSIGVEAFANCKTLTSVSLPDGLLTLGGRAFSGCSALESIDIPSSVSIICESTFSDCSSLATVTLPDSITKIERNAFYNCNSLSSIIIPASVAYIQSNAFDCTNLNYVVLSRTAYNSYAFPYWGRTSSIFHYYYNVLYTDNGHATISGKSISFGSDTLEFTVVTDEHFVVDHIVLTDENNVERTLYLSEDGRCTVSMPDSESNVQISVYTRCSHVIVTDSAVNATCTHTGLTEGSHCSVCGEVIVPQHSVPATGHTPVIDPAVPATTTSTGLTEGSHCSVCGETIVAQTVIPATTPNPATPTQSSSTGSGSNGVYGFVERLYTVALGRNSDPNGQQQWVNTITSGQNTGADVARGFLYSPEFLNKNCGNEEFVRILYRTFFGREADINGLNAWVEVLNWGDSRQSVIEGFINSTEWANLCLSYGISSGGTGSPSVDVEPNRDTIDFATRLYTTCLNRNADEDGLMAWARQLANQRETGTGAARGFFFSTEFIRQNTTNEDYVARLYRTFMGREPDVVGFNAWVNQLYNGVSREEVFNGFAQSPEFTQICAQYGIVRG